MIVAIIQARIGSKRLPGKVLMDIAGKPLILHIIERLGHSKMISSICIATSVSKSDDALERFCKSQGIECYRGPENDLLERFHIAAKKARAQNIVRVWGDCVLIDPKIVDRVIRKYLDEGLDYCSNARPATFPRGNDVEVFSFSALERARKEATDSFYREYMTDYMFRNPDKFRTGNLTQDVDMSGMNWTVDYPEDAEFAASVIESFGKMFYMEDILALLKQRPELLNINNGKARYEDYRKDLRDRGLKYI